ncbi:MAG: P22 phage major capsid protein family protein [Opitutaceae bacterium]|jgi:hypothetical protein
MPNAYNFASWVAMEGLRQLKNRLEIASSFNTDYNKEFRKSFAVGQSVTVPLPQWFNVTTGFGYQPQALDRPSTTVAIDRPRGVHFDVPTPDKELFMERGKDQFQKQYLDPQMAALAQKLDQEAAEWAFYNTPNFVGVLGTDPTNSSIAGYARQRLIELACPTAGAELKFIVPPSAMGRIVDAESTVFNPSSEIAKQYREGYKGRARGFEWYESMSLVRHTHDNWQVLATNEVSGAGQTGTSLVVTSTAGDSYNKGDRFNIAGVYEVNPKTLQATSTLKQFVITDTIASAVGGVGGDTLSILPAIVGPGSHYQNVSALPADGADLTLWPGTTIVPNSPKTGTVGIALHRDAFALCFVPLEVPEKGVIAGDHARDPESGLDMAYVCAWDQITGRRETHRLDTMFGFGNLYFDHCAVAIACG